MDPSVFDRVSVHDRDGSSRNPNAQFPTPVTLEEVQGSRLVASPLRLLHCASIADGATALVVERGGGPVEVLGFGQGLETFRVIDRVDLTTFAATRIAAKQAYEMAHITRKELEVVELHDAFAPFALIDLEDIGVAGRGEAAPWYAEDWVRPDGRLPVNPSGGVLGRGHPVGASSLCEIAEVALQISGAAGAHQVALAASCRVGAIDQRPRLAMLRHHPRSGAPMNAELPPIDLSRCSSCHSLYFPTAGPCPRCGAREVSVEKCPALGVVLAATELSNPPEGFSAPHRIALVELVESARVLAIVDGPLPVAGDTVELLREGDHFRMRGAP